MGWVVPFANRFLGCPFLDVSWSRNVWMCQRFLVCRVSKDESVWKFSHEARITAGSYEV